MEALYESLFSSNNLFREQLIRHLEPEVADNSHWIVYVGPDREIWTNREDFYDDLLTDDSIVNAICDRIDDGCDPVLTPVEKHTIAACELYTEKRSAGYLLLVLKDYTLEVAKTNMDLIELLLNQFRLTAALLEKNNELHQLKLVHLSKSPAKLPC